MEQGQTSLMCTEFKVTEKALPSFVTMIWVGLIMNK